MINLDKWENIWNTKISEEDSCRTLKSKLAQALQDEQKAESFYRDLKRIAVDVHREDFVDILTEIQQDEADHYKKLNEILGKLAS